MRTVIYDSEFMEPITVIDVPQWLFARVQNGGFNEIILAVQPKMPFPVMADPLPIKYEPVLACRLFFEAVRKDGKIMFWFCTTRDGESALLLRSVFLPGQQKEVEEERKNAFFKGLEMALFRE